jgi:hypothetical protein
VREARGVFETLAAFDALAFGVSGLLEVLAVLGVGGPDVAVAVLGATATTPAGAAATG